MRAEARPYRSGAGAASRAALDPGLVRPVLGSVPRRRRRGHRPARGPLPAIHSRAPAPGRDRARTAAMPSPSATASCSPERRRICTIPPSSGAWPAPCGWPCATSTGWRAASGKARSARSLTPFRPTRVPAGRPTCLRPSSRASRRRRWLRPPRGRPSSAATRRARRSCSSTPVHCRPGRSRVSPPGP